MVKGIFGLSCCKMIRVKTHSMVHTIRVREFYEHVFVTMSVILLAIIWVEDFFIFSH